MPYFFLARCESIMQWLRLSREKRKFTAVLFPSAFEAPHTDLHDFNWAFSVMWNTNIEVVSVGNNGKFATKSWLELSESCTNAKSTSGCNGQQFWRLLIFLQNFDQILTLRESGLSNLSLFKLQRPNWRRAKSCFAFYLKLFRCENGIRSTRIKQQLRINGGRHFHIKLSTVITAASESSENIISRVFYSLSGRGSQLVR